MFNYNFIQFCNWNQVFYCKYNDFQENSKTKKFQKDACVGLDSKTSFRCFSKIIFGFRLLIDQFHHISKIDCATRKPVFALAPPYPFLRPPIPIPITDHTCSGLFACLALSSAIAVLFLILRAKRLDKYFERGIKTNIYAFNPNFMAQLSPLIAIG